MTKTGDTKQKVFNCNILGIERMKKTCLKCFLSIHFTTILLHFFVLFPIIFRHYYWWRTVIMDWDWLRLGKIIGGRWRILIYDLDILMGGSYKHSLYMQVTTIVYELLKKKILIVFFATWSYNVNLCNVKSVCGEFNRIWLRKWTPPHNNNRSNNVRSLTWCRGILQKKRLLVLRICPRILWKTGWFYGARRLM